VGIISSIRGERLLADIKASGDASSPQARKAVEKLIAMGPSAIPLVLEAIGDAERKETMAYVDVLSTLADDKTLPRIAAGLTDSNPRTVAAVSWALAGAKGFPATHLLKFLEDPDYSRQALIDIISAQKARIPVRDLIAAAYAQVGSDKTALFRIIGEVVDEQSLPDLLARIDGKDPVARMHLLEILSRFPTPDVESALLGQLKDPNKFIRQAALSALSKMKSLPSVEPVAKALTDNDVEVQNRAVEVLINAKHPDTIKHLVPVLKDESEYARRSAVEVLNEICDQRSVKFLLEAIKDADWWVRSRAADALGKIGGPRVVEAVLALVKDPDEEIRRTAIEILNLTKDERAVDYLLQATRDSDWWVSERAIDALGEIGAKKAAPRLLEMMQGNVKAAPAAIRALGKLGDTAIIEVLVPQLNRPEKDIRVEVLGALARLADEQRADEVKREIEAVAAQAGDPTVLLAAQKALEALESRFSTAEREANAKARALQGPTSGPARTLLMDAADLAAIVKQGEAAASAAARLDISQLQSGDVIEGRYRYIEKIGKGAFGTVLLMEDTVVEERLILKFLNPNVSQDEEMMKRFVHELRYSRKITHPNVIRIYDFLYIKGNYAISMEYFPSHTLGAEIVNDTPIALPRALQFGIDICTGMTVAHQVGVVHRDLKPANVLINDTGLLKIVDFGVAAAQREGDTQLTKTGYVIGSPKYMAPEQILGKKVDPRADLYSVGVILYEMLTGVPPYARGDHMSVMYQHVQGKARPPIDINKSLPQQLSDLVMKAMSVDKAKRYQTMDELKAALERFR
jgi:serine/threonine-protein kinase